MSGFLTGLIARHAGAADVIRPHVPALFEPQPGGMPMASDSWGDMSDLGERETAALAGLDAHGSGGVAPGGPLDDERAAWPASGRARADASKRPASGDGARGVAPSVLPEAARRAADIAQQSGPARPPQSGPGRDLLSDPSREPRLWPQPERSAAVEASAASSGDPLATRGPHRPTVAAMHEASASLRENIKPIAAESVRTRAREAVRPAPREGETAGVLLPLPHDLAQPQADAAWNGGLPPRRLLREGPGTSGEAGNDPARHREPETTVHVTIGRLEIRAEQAASGSAPRPRDGPRAASLADYLRASAARSRA